MAGDLRALCTAAALGLAALASGCASHSNRILEFRTAWGGGDLDRAEKAIDELLAAESGAPVEVVSNSNALDSSVNPKEGNTYLLLLEKAMTRLARGDAKSSLRLLLAARDELDDHYSATFADYFSAALTDDESRAYSGADYEHILVRVMLAVTDLLVAEGDAYAYALQVGEKQEEIIGSDFGDAATNYYPRRQYQRVAAGAYMQGVVQEANLAPSEAAIAYQRGLGFAGGNVALRDALARARSGKYAANGCGVLHVFYFGGRGPHLEADYRSPEGNAIQLAAIGAAFVGGSVANLGQTAVPVPKVVVTDPVIPPLAIAVDGGPPSSGTSLLLDVNQVAVQQNEANMPGVVARAMVRRAVKGGIGAAIESEGSSTAQLMGFLFTAISTGTERAETRSWVSLPAQIHVARVEVPEGVHRISFGDRNEVPVRVARGADSYAVVIRPNLGLPGSVVVDANSRVDPIVPPAPAAPDPNLPPIPPPAAPDGAKTAPAAPAPAAPAPASGTGPGSGSPR